jgi:uncharacterized protein
LGLGCNYKCSYCVQGWAQYENKQELKFKEFVDLIPVTNKEKRRIIFWGGEPLLYYNKIRELVPLIAGRFPDSQFELSTNGALLDLSKNKWLEEEGFRVSISHDGPGQGQRGVDILEDISKKSIVMDLLTRLSPDMKFSFNPVVTRANPSRAIINKWFTNIVGHKDIILGEGVLVHPVSEQQRPFCFSNIEEHLNYRLLVLREIRDNEAPETLIYKTSIYKFVTSVLTQRSLASIKSTCWAKNDSFLAVDLAGNILTCHNFPHDHVFPNGNTNSIGHLRKITDVKMNTIIPWYTREECRKCVVLHFCGGGCVATQKEVKELACDQNFSEYIPYFVAGIEMLTGYIPYYIEGEETREDRRDIFGTIAKGEEYI